MPTANAHFESFLKSDDAIWIIGAADGITFRSQQRGIAPLLSYIEQTPLPEEVIILDKVTGNAAALLMIKACCREVFSPIGSDPAVETLNSFGVISHFTQTVPHIINREGTGICPFETMSLGKSPDEFYELARHHPLFTDIFRRGKS